MGVAQERACLTRAHVQASDDPITVPGRYSVLANGSIPVHGSWQGSTRGKWPARHEAVGLSSFPFGVLRI
jgi:hypothetical protein